MPEPRRVLGWWFFEVVIYQTEYLFCLILSIHKDVTMRKASPHGLAIFIVLSNLEMMGVSWPSRLSSRAEPHVP